MRAPIIAFHSRHPLIKIRWRLATPVSSMMLTGRLVPRKLWSCTEVQTETHGFQRLFRSSIHSLKSMISSKSRRHTKATSCCGWSLQNPLPCAARPEERADSAVHVRAEPCGPFSRITPDQALRLEGFTSMTVTLHPHVFRSLIKPWLLPTRSFPLLPHFPILESLRVSAFLQLVHF